MGHPRVGLRLKRDRDMEREEQRRSLARGQSRGLIVIDGLKRRRKKSPPPTPAKPTDPKHPVPGEPAKPERRDPSKPKPRMFSGTKNSARFVTLARTQPHETKAAPWVWVPSGTFTERTSRTRVGWVKFSESATPILGRTVHVDVVETTRPSGDAAALIRQMAETGQVDMIVVDAEVTDNDSLVRMRRISRQLSESHGVETIFSVQGARPKVRLPVSSPRSTYKQRTQGRGFSGPSGT